jgi:lysophospholipid acyltransferase (LPLAT)-like uncharacterized protein
MSEKLSVGHLIFINFINLISKTWRIKAIGEFPQNNNGIIVFWHTFMLPCWKIFSDKKASAVVSLSKDGEILSTLLAKMGFSLIRGSSSRNGKEVLAELVETANKSYLLLTPDGPRGPIYEFKAGAAVAAFRTGKPLYLFGVKINKYIKFNKSWDKFRFPLPFTKITLDIRGPIYLNSNLSKEEISEKIINFQETLKEISDL